MGASHSGTAIVEGQVSPGYEGVREMFKKNVETGREREAQLCIYVDGEVVVDLWGSAEGDTSYNGDSLQCIFSSSKAVTAIAVAKAAERGLVQYSAPVASYWPEFAQGLKGETTIADMLRHEGGMPHLDTSLSLEDLLPSALGNGVAAEVLAKQNASMPVDTPREYHGLTAGWVIGEVVRRVSGRTLGTWVREDVAGPLGADVFLGLQESELPKVRDVEGLSTSSAMLNSLLPNAMGGQVDHNIIVFSKILKSFKKRFQEKDPRNYAPDLIEMDIGQDPSDFISSFFNLRGWREAESPHGSMHASARGLARIAAAMAGGGRLGDVEVLNKRGWDLLHGNPVVRVDATMHGCRTEFTQGGVNKFEDYEDDKMGERILKSGRAGFVGWMGFGGSVMQWHPGLDMGFGYTCSLLTWWDLANTKARKLQKEAVRCALALKNEKADMNNNIPEVALAIASSVSVPAEKTEETESNVEGVSAA